MHCTANTQQQINISRPSPQPGYERKQVPCGKLNGSLAKNRQHAIASRYNVILRRCSVGHLQLTHLRYSRFRVLTCMENDLMTTFRLLKCRNTRVDFPAFLMRQVDRLWGT